MSWSLLWATTTLPCPGVQIRGALQTKLQLSWPPVPRGVKVPPPTAAPQGSQPGQSLSKVSALTGCEGERESKRSKSREQALTADGFCPLLSASCNRPELLPRAGSALPSQVLLAAQMLSQPPVPYPQPLAGYRQGGQKI